ncbi:S4 domain-containing protein YaaA [Paenibacillus sp. J2TS4]|uniref:S4 domain-containing protein YaaA n=1 Tax=Paenibacillus sp. J2TS4 TaxID=2807194 RepID=UPI001B25A551|nr:S4 domain-containing protein YaaA [Paenibacillus sp. J2TS4]GIP36031.1 hypothetical protein J2TS4_52410 [Paenibacillus sp. J2TS4]
MKSISITTDYITLGQFLKLANCVSTGGHAKIFLQETTIRVNQEMENRRGKKLVPGDIVQVDGCGTFQVVRS